MIKSESVKIIEVRDWDALIKKTYNKFYSFQQQEGCKSRGIFRFSVPVDKYEMEEQEEYMHDEIEEKVNGEQMGVKFEKWLERSIDKPVSEDDWGIELFWDRNFYPSELTLINDLYEKGLIEAGEYAINIDW
jgi:hypothetical protein